MMKEARKTNKVSMVPIIATTKNRFKKRLKKRIPARRTITTTIKISVPSMKLGHFPPIQMPALVNPSLFIAYPRVAKVTDIA